VDLWTAVLADDVDGAGGRRTVVGRLMERELVCRLWAEAAAAGGRLQERRLGQSREKREGPLREQSERAVVVKVGKISGGLKGK